MTIELEVEKLSNKVDHMANKLDKMYELLIGSELDESTGYRHKIQQLEKTVKELSDFKQKMVYVAVGMSIPTGMGLMQIIQYFIGLK